MSFSCLLNFCLATFLFQFFSKALAFFAVIIVRGIKNLTREQTMNKHHANGLKNDQLRNERLACCARFRRGTLFQFFRRVSVLHASKHSLYFWIVLHFFRSILSFNRQVFIEKSAKIVVLLNKFGFWLDIYLYFVQVYLYYFICINISGIWLHFSKLFGRNLFGTFSTRHVRSASKRKNLFSERGQNDKNVKKLFITVWTQINYARTIWTSAKINGECK